MQAGRTANQLDKYNMAKITNTTEKTPKKLVEQALMMAVRFRVLLYKNKPDASSAARLSAAINALNLQLTVSKPSIWMRENFMNTSSSFAGYYWQVTFRDGRYFVELDEKPLSKAVAKKTQLRLVAG